MATTEQQAQLDALDAFHGQAKALILHGGGPEGAQKAGINIAGFLKIAGAVFAGIWPTIQPEVSQIISKLVEELLAKIGTTTPGSTPDPALPPKA